VGSDLSGASAVLFGGRPAASFTVKRLDEVTAISPPGKGTVDVTVVTARGVSATSSGDLFTYRPAGAPKVAGVSPAQGFRAGGTSVTIAGTDLIGATEVTFGSTPAASFEVTATGTIIAVAPPGTGTVDVTVATPLGTSSVTANDRFTYLAPARPTVAGLVTKRGPITGGTSVTIFGANFLGAEGVQFGGVEASSFTVNSAGSITAVAPPGASGPVDVVVTTAAGSSPVTKKDLFKYGGPIISSVVANHGPVAGGVEVLISGTGFAPGSATVFRFGKQAAIAVDCTSSSSCTAVTPAALKAGWVAVKAAIGASVGSASPAARYHYE
jgi:hypothetical protein